MGSARRTDGVDEVVKLEVAAAEEATDDRLDAAMMAEMQALVAVGRVILRRQERRDAAEQEQGTGEPAATFEALAGPCQAEAIRLLRPVDPAAEPAAVLEERSEAWSLVPELAALRYVLVRLLSAEADPNKLVTGVARIVSAAATGYRAAMLIEQYDHARESGGFAAELRAILDDLSRESPSGGDEG